MVPSSHQSNQFQNLWYSKLHFVESLVIFYLFHSWEEGSNPWQWWQWWQQNLQIKYYELYHCYICNIILKVIQWSLTWNILLIWFMKEGFDPWQYWQWNPQMKYYKQYHCYNCNIICLLNFFKTWDCTTFIVQYAKNYFGKKIVWMSRM